MFSLVKYGIIFVGVKNLFTPSLRVLMNVPSKRNKIPDRWTDYKALGRRIPGTRFVAFKVPLKQSFRKRLPSLEAFGPFDLVRLLREEKEELGLIIDLTFTTRYYKPTDLPDSLYYLKIFTAGHDVPSDPTILRFKKAVNRFLRENNNNDKLIGVHCTHGLNRTGYLVCRYLIDVEGMVPSEAIALFNRSRGHPIERENYLVDLCCGPKRSNDGMEEPDQEPIRGSVSCRQEDSPIQGSSPLSEKVPSHEHNMPLNHRGMKEDQYSAGPAHPPPLPPYEIWPTRPCAQEQGWSRTDICFWFKMLKD
ncbi:RNA/RNP complex-1-interacting phosphatase-like isoform X3 [Megalops cyprinoides]|uniref:RNA/RNP complex-1-interacting phosphatase-like isoform X3 n=1 Tax=Megalops cyprinoides TaxID=118141 RepID=UPI0018652D93|nr:RNA/RNP complex-1-interacting phosphatase-like isoform X3 [Megalops cyprinoides]